MSLLRQLRKRIIRNAFLKEAKANLVAGAGKEYWALNRKTRRAILFNHLKKMLTNGALGNWRG